MLSLSRSLRRAPVARIARSQMPRALCVPAEGEPRLADEINAAIAEMKEKIAAPSSTKGYSPAQFEAAMKAGTVDVSMVNEALDGFNDSARKLVLKCVAESNAIKKQLDSPPNFDALFAEYEKKLGAELTAEVKAVADAAVAEAEAAAAADTTFAELEKEVNEAFKGSNGLFELASKEEKAAEASMAASLKEMEGMSVYVDGVKDLTIAEILEREPELRAEIEEELKNDVWAP